MPVEILEIVVRANVQEPAPMANLGAANVSSSSHVIDREKIIQECVEQVLDILQHQKER